MLTQAMSTFQLWRERAAESDGGVLVPWFRERIDGLHPPQLRQGAPARLSVEVSVLDDELDEEPDKTLLNCQVRDSNPDPLFREVCPF